jgi:hypothetical protein
MKESIIQSYTVMYYWLRTRKKAIENLEAGSVAETVVLTALFVSLAIVAGTIIYNAVKTKASSINYTTP